MPIEFAPPPPATQGYQITPPQSTDPLQTLAQMGQLRTQGLQQQSAQLGLQQQQLKMQSQKAMVNAFAQGGTPDQIYQRAIASGQVLPEDAIAFQQHQMKYQTDAAALDEKKRAMLSEDIGNYVGAASQATDQASLDAANAAAAKRGLFDSKKFDPIAQYPGDNTHFQAQLNGLLSHKQILDQTKTQGDIAEAAGKTALSGVQTTEARQKVDVGEKAAVAQELQNADLDPKTNTPTPAAMAAIQQRHPTVILPPPTREGVDKFVRSVVPPEKLPEYDLNKMKADVGLLGNSEFDQYQLRYAQSINKKPNQLTFPEMQTVLQQYAKDKQTPELLEAILGLKASQGTLAKAQVAAMPTDAELEAEARDYRNLDMPPSRLAAMREGRVQYFPQLLEKARAQAAAEGKPFSPADLEQKYDVRTETEKAFTGDGAQAQKIIGFENLMRHTGLLWKAKDALAQNDFPLMRQIANTVGSKVGSDAKTTYDMISTFVSDEAAKTFLPGGGGEGERAKTLAHVSSDLGATQTKNNLKNLMELADSQRQTLERQYAEGTFGKGTRMGRLFSLDAIANRDMVMGKKPAPDRGPSGKIIVKAGDGSIHPFDTETQAKTFENSVKAAGGTTSRQ